MGASGWDYRVPYAGSVEAALFTVQEKVLASGDFLWPWEEFDPDEDEMVPRPTSMAELNAAKGQETFWDAGTHTILDVDRMVAGDNDEIGGIRPLTEDELVKWFGSVAPSAADFERVPMYLQRVHETGTLGDLTETRWTGRSMVLYRDGKPDEVVFWGYSGD
jgi:hypothetical protein